LEQTKKELNEYIYSNWDVESIVITKDRSGFC